MPYKIWIGVHPETGELVVGHDEVDKLPDGSDIEQVYGSQLPHRVAVNNGEYWEIGTPTTPGYGRKLGATIHYGFLPKQPRMEMA